MVGNHRESLSNVSLSGISIIQDYNKEGTGNSTASKEVMSKGMGIDDTKLQMPDLEVNKFEVAVYKNIYYKYFPNTLCHWKLFQNCVTSDDIAPLRLASSG